MIKLFRMKILIMGLPNSGKTTLANKLALKLDAVWFNADIIREQCKFHTFSAESREIQAKRMRTYAEFEIALGKIVICDFICPTIKTRELFDADFIIWMNTISKGEYEDTNLLFQKPENYDLKIDDFDYDLNEISKLIQNHK